MQLLSESFVITSNLFMSGSYHGATFAYLGLSADIIILV